MNLYKRFKQNSFFGPVLLLMASAGVAQLLPILAMPFLTRLYTASDFGIWALFNGIASVISVVATGRYELAVMLPKRDEDAGSLAVLSTVVAGTVSVVLLAVVALFNQQLCSLLGVQEIGPWLYLVPVSVFFSGVYQTFNWWHNRHKKFKSIAGSRVAQSGSGAVGQLAAGMVGGGPIGLIFGTILGQGIAAFVLVKHACSADMQALRKVTWGEIKANAKTYIKFPKYSMFGALVDSASLQMPVFMLNRFFSSQIAGMFSFTFRVLNLPMSLISSALSQVFFQRIIAIRHKDPAKVRSYVLRMAALLAAVMVPFVILIGFFGEDLFSIIFGNEWREAGDFAAILSVAVGVRFVVSPLSSVMAIEHNVRLGVLWQVLYFLTISTTLYLCRHMEIGQFFRVFAIHEVILYGLYFVFIWYGARVVRSEETCAE